LGFDIRLGPIKSSKAAISSALRSGVTVISRSPNKTIKPTIGLDLDFTITANSHPTPPVRVFFADYYDCITNNPAIDADQPGSWSCALAQQCLWRTDFSQRCTFKLVAHPTSPFTDNDTNELLNFTTIAIQPNIDHSFTTQHSISDLA
jgi:hypothetical protein